MRSHYDMAQLGVDLGIQPGIADQVDDPAFGFVRFHVQLIGQHADRDTLMDTAERLEDHQTGIFDELLQTSDDEEIVHDHRLALVQLHPGALEVKVHVQVFQELGDWVAVGVRLLLDDLYQILESVSPASVDDDSCGQVAQNVRTHSLDRIQIQWFVQEHLDDQIASLGMVEEHQNTPVDQPGALLQHLDWREVVVIDEITQTGQILKRGWPVQGKDLGRQFTPQNSQVVLIGRLHDQQANVQVGNRIPIVSALVQVLGQLLGAFDDVIFELKRKKIMGSRFIVSIVHMN